ncbi:sigma-70 family RNA polymerase sigma factor [Roseateles amylovorans]|uniref:Sigma-70 family RNA polymerase sigma factor n=1 Tax=Roseateles amylovorans TaxID=2978473 RepID=A0ABY6ATK0_9BURK|nr:sigma-70 family RNA polymerase sigma factor [Roseateles amylovorans]UXH76162.1 sigma-70 family RNA polymerase sigma factor [Roseateles amylovorans]
MTDFADGTPDLRPDLAEPSGSDLLRHLLARVVQRDRDAFERIYHATSAHLFSIALRVLRDEQRADEVLQDAYVSIWQRADSYRSDVASPMTWMINVVRNRAIDALRSSRRERDCLVELDEEMLKATAADPSGDPYALLDASLMKARLDRCMLQLASTQRQALALAYYRGLVHTEIADLLDTPLGTVKSRLRGGLEQLRSCLDAAGTHALNASNTLNAPKAPRVPASRSAFSSAAPTPWCHR